MSLCDIVHSTCKHINDNLCILQTSILPITVSTHFHSHKCCSKLLSAVSVKISYQCHCTYEHAPYTWTNSLVLRLYHARKCNGNTQRDLLEAVNLTYHQNYAKVPDIHTWTLQNFAKLYCQSATLCISTKTTNLFSKWRNPQAFHRLLSIS